MRFIKEQPHKSHEQGILPKSLENLQTDRSFFAFYCVLLRFVLTDAHPPTPRKGCTPLRSMSLTLFDQLCGFGFYVAPKEEPDKRKCLRRNMASYIWRGLFSEFYGSLVGRLTCWSAEWWYVGSNPGLTNTQGL